MKTKDLIAEFTEQIGTVQTVDWMVMRNGEHEDETLTGEILEVNDTFVFVETPDQDEKRIPLRMIVAYWNDLFTDNDQLIGA